METTHTMAGHLAVAGAARLRAVAPVTCLPGAVGTAAVGYAAAAHPVSVHQATTWISGALAKPATSMAFFGKNRPTRPLSERSP